MATIDITRGHSLGAAEARARAVKLIDALAKDGIAGAWNGNTYTMSKLASGKLVVTDTTVHIEIDLPFILRALKGKIESQINHEIDAALK